MNEPERPDCPECGTENPVSHGNTWQCQNCRRSWSKHFRKRRKDLGLRPNCPECGTANPISQTPSWHCNSCGCSWRKIKQGSSKPDYSKRAPCPECGAYYGMILDSQRYHCGNCGRRYQKDWQDKLVIQEEFVILVDNFQEVSIGAGMNTP